MNFLLSYILNPLFKIFWNLEGLINKLLRHNTSILSSFHLQMHNSFDSRKFLTSWSFGYQSEFGMILSNVGLPYVVEFLLYHNPFIS